VVSGVITGTAATQSLPSVFEDANDDSTAIDFTDDQFYLTSQIDPFSLERAQHVLSGIFSHAAKEWSNVMEAAVSHARRLVRIDSLPMVESHAHLLLGRQSICTAG
jgi:hypothetical protein